MQTKEASLLRQWRLLSDEVVPRLSARRTPGCPSVWADGDVSDAVAVSLAYRHARPGRTRDLAVFATPASGEPSGVWYSMSDIRTLPAAVLREGLCRGARGWMPAPGVAEQVQLGRPNRPVDLLVVRGCHTGSRRRGHPGALLRPGGYLLLLGDGEPELASDPHLETVPGTPLLRRKKGSGGPPVRWGRPTRR